LRLGRVGIEFSRLLREFLLVRLAHLIVDEIADPPPTAIDAVSCVS